jgi:CRP-like cAMP-binding protein
VNIPVRLGISGLPTGRWSHARDIGTGGLCVVCSHPVRADQVRSVRITFPTRSIEASVDARWSDCGEADDTTVIGLSFVDLVAADRHLIWDFIMSRALELAKFLNEQSDLGSLDLTELVNLALVSRLRSVTQGVSIYEPDDDCGSGESLYVIYRGRVRQTLDRDEGVDSSCELSEGKAFGGLAWLFDGTSRGWCRTLDDTLLLEIDGHALRWLERSSPLVLQRLLHALTNTQHARILSARIAAARPAGCLRP